jgi:hypothetical protein
MIGFLFGLAAGTVLGFILGAIAAYGARTGCKVDRIFKDPTRPKSTWPDPIDHPEPFTRIRRSAGVRVCTCIGNPSRAPHFVDSECPFHGGAA